MGKRQIITFEQNVDGITTDNNNILFVRVSDTVEDKDAQFVVPITHNAYVIKGGGDMRFYKSGTYDVFDARSEIKAWKRGIPLDIVYMPKETNIEIKWGTPDKFRYRDFSSNKVIKIGARGQFRIAITNPEQFYRKVVGSSKRFIADDFQNKFRIDVVNEFRDCFLQVVKEEQLTYDQFDSNLKLIGTRVGKVLSTMFDKSWGISLVDFIIMNIVLEDEDIDAVEEASAEAQRQKQIKEYLAELERLDDKQWEREKYLRELELRDKNAYYEVLKIIGHPTVPPMYGQPQQPYGMQPQQPMYGQPQQPMYGMQPQQPMYGGGANAFCPGCGASVAPGNAFCPKCGMRVVQQPQAPAVCPTCGAPAIPGNMFCPKCGTKLN